MNVERSSRQRRTLVVHTGGIGDFLLFCPALKRLAEDGPVELAGVDRDRLNLAVVAGIASNAHLLDDVGFASVFSGGSERFNAFAARFDRAIIWMSDTDGRVHDAFAKAGVREVRLFAGIPPPDWTRHASAYYAECLGYADLPPLVLHYEADEGEHDVLIHAGSGGARKNWPIDRFAAVANALSDRGRRVEWIRGPAEEALALPGGARTLEVASVITLARHISGTALYVGNDSGVSHLAAACRCRTVAIFGPTDPKVWAPRGSHVSVVANVEWTTAEDVLKELERSSARHSG